jgi:hypothetical protein
VEEDHGDSEGEDELSANPAERVLDEAEELRPDERTNGHQQAHLRYSQESSDELRDETRAEYESEVEEDVFYFQYPSDSSIGCNGSTARYSSSAVRSKHDPGRGILARKRSPFAGRASRA